MRRVNWPLRSLLLVAGGEHNTVSPVASCIAPNVIAAAGVPDSAFVSLCTCHSSLLLQLSFQYCLDLDQLSKSVLVTVQPSARGGGVRSHSMLAATELHVTSYFKDCKRGDAKPTHDLLHNLPSPPGTADLADCSQTIRLFKVPCCSTAPPKGNKPMCAQVEHTSSA